MTHDEFIVKVAGHVCGQMIRRQASWVLPWTGVQLAGFQAHNPLSKTSTYNGLNALLLQSHAISQGMPDAAFVSARQAKTAGWLPRGALSKGVDIQFVPAPGRADSPRVYTVHHVSEFENAPRPELVASEVPSSRVVLDRLERNAGIRFKFEGASSAFYSPEDGLIHIPRPEAFVDDTRFLALALREAAFALIAGRPAGCSADLSPLQQHLRAELASFFVGTQLALGHDPSSDREVVAAWVKLLQTNPGEIAAAALDAQRLADRLVSLAVDLDQRWTRTTPAPASEVVPNSDEADPILVGSPGERVYLAVPFAEIVQARRLGADFDRDQKVWWVDSQRDLAPFEKWMVTNATLVSAGLNAGDVIAEFENVMRDFGLIVDGPIHHSDGKWHYVPTESSKGREKNGSYILDLNGKPSGAVKNFKTGEGTTWRYGGGRLTPEQRAALEAQAKAQASLREREIAEVHSSLARSCTLEFRALASDEAEHPYLSRKGVGAYGVKVADAVSVDVAKLLNLSDGDFARKTGSWLIVPGQGIDGQIWTLQAIDGDRNGPKLFTKNARKKGAFHIIGASSVEDLMLADTVGFAEGYATAASIYEATSIPVVVAFDSQNLPEVARQVAPRLPSQQSKIVFADNDQFFVDRLVRRIADQNPSIADSVEARSRSLHVFTDGRGGVREIEMHGVIADGEWHQTGEGKYRLGVESITEIASGSSPRVAVATSAIAEFVDLSGKVVRLPGAKNSGVTAAGEAAAHLSAIVIAPEFSESQLSLRPTDFNDMASLVGLAGVRSHIESLRAPRSASVVAQAKELGISKSRLSSR